MSETTADILIAPVRLTDEDAIQVMRSWSEGLTEQGLRTVSFDLAASRIPEEAADTDAVLVPCAVFGQEDAVGYPMSDQTLRVIRYGVEHKKAVFSEAPLAQHLESSRSDTRPASTSGIYRLPDGYVIPELPEGLEATVIGQDVDVMKEKLGVM